MKRLYFDRTALERQTLLHWYTVCCRRYGTEFVERGRVAVFRKERKVLLRKPKRMHDLQLRRINSGRVRQRSNSGDRQVGVRMIAVLVCTHYEATKSVFIRL